MFGVAVALLVMVIFQIAQTMPASSMVHMIVRIILLVVAVIALLMTWGAPIRARAQDGPPMCRMCWFDAYGHEHCYWVRCPFPGYPTAMRRT